MLARRQSGDTIIEVMFSFAVFSLVVVSAIVLMNQGIAMAQRSLEITLVRQQIDSQITMVQHARQAKNAIWSELKSDAQGSISDFSSMNTCPGATDLQGAGANFVAATNSTGTDIALYEVAPSTFESAPAYAMVDVLRRTVTSGPRTYGIWMTLVRAEGYGGNPAYDLHVRACWASVGTSRPMTIGTVTRLYD